MKIVEFAYKNIISYGNKLQKITFEDKPQLILVEGENGEGKSSIKEALTVSIYGKSAIRKMKDIPNWINKNAYTYINFVTNSGSSVEIDRGIDPNFSDIKINGTSYNLPDKKKVDDYVEEELVKIPFSVFCNTISLSFDDFKSFVNLSQGDKRKIVDRIFGIDVLTEMRAVVKEELKENKKVLDSINSEIFTKKSILDSSIDQLEILREKLSKKKDNKSDELSSEIKDKTGKLDDIRIKYNEIKTQISDIQAQVNSARESLSKCKHSISDLGEKLELYQNNRCPHCLNDLTSSASIKTKEAIENKKKALEESIPSLREKFTELQSDLEQLLNSQNSLKSEYQILDSEIKKLQDTLKKASEEIETDETDSIKSIIEKIKSEISDCESKISSQENQNEVYYILDELLSDTGIKKTLIDKIIPTLNSKIKEISEKLEFKFNFEFNNEFNPIIHYLGMDISPESLSSGQRKKMNLIVILAFIELIKMKHSQMNIMFLDEIFSSLDKNNIYKAIEILRQYADKYKMTIFVVSHEALPEEFFDSKISVKMVDGFSDMKITSSTKSE